MTHSKTEITLNFVETLSQDTERTLVMLEGTLCIGASMPKKFVVKEDFNNPEYQYDLDCLFRESYERAYNSLHQFIEQETMFYNRKKLQRNK